MQQGFVELNGPGKKAKWLTSGRMSSPASGMSEAM